MSEKISRRAFIGRSLAAGAAVAAGGALLLRKGVESEGESHPLAFGEASYKNAERLPQKNFRNLKPKGLAVRPQNNTLANLRLSGRMNRLALDGSPLQQRAGRIERVLRYKNISDAVERRYNLPSGILLSMVMQESSGADIVLNARDDGGAGLSHMQPPVAREYGLSLYGNSRKMVDREHGVALRGLVEKLGSDPFALAQYDERFNRVLNLDAVGRMLATHMSGRLIKDKNKNDIGPLETAVMRYAGAYNFSTYWNRLKEHMTDLHDLEFVKGISDAFDKRNAQLHINGKPVPVGESPFMAYVKTSWEENEKGFDLDTYRKLPLYLPNRSQEVLKTYRSSLIKPRA